MCCPVGPGSFTAGQKKKKCIHEKQRILFTSEDTLLTKEQAAEASADILNRIYSAALRMESGDLIWLSFDPGREDVYLMDAGLYSGYTGLALFFAAMVQAATDAKNRRKSTGMSGFVHADGGNVTLFYGLAGIGYELIRYTDKNRFPTIL